MKLIIATGGRGRRLRLTKIPSKAFILLGNKTLLEYTIDSLPNSKKKIYLAYNYEDQKKEAKKILKQYRFLKIQFIKCSEKDPFFALPDRGSCLLIFSDALVTKPTLRRVIKEFKKRKITVTLRQKTCKLSDKVRFLEKGGYIWDWKMGKPNFEIGQVFYFSNNALKIIKKILPLKGRFEAIREVIKKEGIFALPDYCLNINEPKDVEYAKKVLKNEINNK